MAEMTLAAKAGMILVVLLLIVSIVAYHAWMGRRARPKAQPSAPAAGAGPPPRPGGSERDSQPARVDPRDSA